MFVKLSKGEARIRVWFGTEPDGRRSTSILFEWLVAPGMLNRSDKATVVCSKQDNFCKRTGRKLALNKLLYGFPSPVHPITKTHRRLRYIWTGIGYVNELTKDDRRTLWQAICPEFFRVCQSLEEALAEQTIIPYEENVWSHPEIGGES